MFGFGRKKAPEPPKKTARAQKAEQSKDRKAQNLAQLGFLVGVEDDEGSYDAGLDDADLEDELMMLLNDEDPPPRSKPKPKSAPPRPVPPSRGIKSGAPSIDKYDLDIKMDDSGEDDDDVDLDDPELEAELGELTGEAAITPEQEDVVLPSPPAASTKSLEQMLPILQERLDLYEKAKTKADSSGDSGKSRRFTRGIKTLKELITKANAGKTIDESEIPPIVSLGASATVPLSDDNINNLVEPNVPVEPLQPEERAPTPEPDYPFVEAKLPEPLIPTPAYIDIPKPVDSYVPEPEPQQTRTTDPAVDQRLKDYKKLAVCLKRSGDIQGALLYLKLSKALESAVKSGDPVDLSNFPAIPEFADGASDNSPLVTIAASVPIAPPTAETDQVQSSSGEVNTQDASQGNSAPQDLFSAPPPPGTVMEALEQRLDKYKSEVEKANSASNGGKARRMGRIVKQYEEAITLHRKGKPVPFEDLPTPPGFAPFPVGGAVISSGNINPPAGPSRASGFTPKTEPVEIIVRPQPEASDESPEKKVRLPGGEPRSPQPGPSSALPSPGGTSSIQRGGKPPTKLTLQEKQLALIVKRQQQFKEAALNAKKRGDVDQAREFLRTAKQFDKLIQASQAGLPVDIATLPGPPEDVAALEAEDFEVVTEGDCILATGDAAEVFTKLEEDLKTQMGMCMRTRDHFKSSGDIGSANRFESLALETKRDLDTLRLAVRKGQELPKYHYETRIFSITECNTDINDDEIEISVLQGVNYKVSNPSDVDTYVKVELPYPSAEEAQSKQSHIVKDTNNPAYNVTYKMNINRTARNFQRFVHRHGIKFEVWSKGGFLRGSTLIGTVTVKLLPLENKCVLHDAFDILDGRKSVGKLEVKIRIRDPVLIKQITQKREKWLSIDRA